MGTAAPIPNVIQGDCYSSNRKRLFWIRGSAKNMYANRVSFSFDFNGPSIVVDTACSSSCVALDLAVTDLRLGKCDQAIVGTTKLNLQPHINYFFQAMPINAYDGISRVWDERADGFVRSETIECILLQKKSKAKRIYATVIHSKTNIDGYKKVGGFFLQQKLMEETYIEAGIDPNQIDYFEAHATGTVAGDTEEAEAIANAYCKGRQKPLLIGLLKSNIGYGGGTSGLASVTKAIISFENKCIPANLYPKIIKPSIAKFCPPLEPVMKNTKFEPNLCGINSFGLGGVNAHLILKAHKKELSPDSHLIADKIPRLVNCCGRTQHAVDYVFDFIERNPSKITKDFLAALNETSKVTQNPKTPGMPFRGSMIIRQKDVNEDGTINYNYSRKNSVCYDTSKPIWFFFSGVGSQWSGMAKSMMTIDKFKESIDKCAETLKPLKIDLIDILLTEDEAKLKPIVTHFVAISAMQIALLDVINYLGIQPEKIIGHSFSEILCAYADGCLTLEQTMLCSYWRGKVVENSNIPDGKMAVVGLSWEEAAKRCPENVYVACDNAYDSVTISGLEKETTKFIEQLKSEGVFVLEVTGHNLKPYHSVQIKPIADTLTNIIKKVIPNPKKRSKKWVSTSIPEKNWSEELAQYASAEYYVNNMIKPVLFTSGLSHAPDDAIVIEITPHALFKSLIKRTLKNVNYIGLMKRNDNDHNLETFISSIGQLYQLGINPSIENLYPKVEWPVARGTQSISSLMKWDHTDSYFVKKYPEFHFKPTVSDLVFDLALDDPDDLFLQDHVIDGKMIFPATGYLLLAWKRLAAQRGQQWNEFPVVFENVQFRRAVMYEKDKAKLTVRYTEPTGEFVILDGVCVVAFGHIRAAKDNELQLQDLIENFDKYDSSVTDDIKLNTQEFYRELRTRGYDYGPKFQGVVESKFIDETKSIGKVRISNLTEFITCLDSMLQLMINGIPIRSLFVPILIQSFKCDPLMFYGEVNKHKVYFSNSNKNIDEDVSDELQKEEQEIYEKHKDLVEKEVFTKAFKEVRTKSVKSKKKWFYDIQTIVDMELNAVIAKGIEFRNIISSDLPRKFLSDRLRLERYEFIPFDEDNTIENYNRNELLKYLNVCSMICKQISEKKIFKVSIGNFMNHLKVIQVDQKDVDEMTMDIDEDHTLLRTLHFLSNEKDIYQNLNYDNMINELKVKFEKMEFDVSKDIINLVGRNERLIRPLIDTVNENVTPIKELNILEINMTNGIISIDILQMQSETFILPISVRYTIVNKTPEKIKQIKEIENLGECNIIEWMNCKTNFPENINKEFNLIIHRDSNELWKVDLNEYFKSASKVLKENGFLLGVFRLRITISEAFLNELLENESLPSEKRLINRIETFVKIANENGFKMIMRKTDSLLFTAILFRKINKNIKANQQTVFEIKTGKYEEWLEPFKQIIEDHKQKDKNEKIWLYAGDSNINGIIGLTQCLRLESGGDKLRYIFDVDNRLPKKIDFNLNPFKDILESDLVMNVFRDNKFGSMKHLSVPKDYDQIETIEAYVNLMQKGDLSSMQWLDGSDLNNPLLSFAINDMKQVDVDIYYSAFNFRDVMMATGKIGGSIETGILPCQFGTEFAGRRRDTGERVCGMSLNFGIANAIKTNEPLLFKIPDQWTMEEAATILTVYMTCWYGLIKRGQMQAGESILIHSAAGGVGQTAINICQHYKCKVFTTVSTQEKRDFLKKTFGLTDDQIFNSRDTEFERKIMRATKGQGVDLVLNSLAEDKLFASFRCLGFDGRFIEIGKYDFQMNNPLPMFAFLKNITFHGIDINQIIILNKKDYINIFEEFNIWLYEGINLGFVKPLKRTVFDYKQVKEAFKYMMTGKHIGKVLIKVRDEEPYKMPLKPKPMTITATTQTWFDSEKVYIIIGGLGGMGLEMVYWMIFKGAKKFILTSRSGIKSNSQRFVFKVFEELGKKITSLKSQIKISTLNVVEEQNVKKLFQEAETMGKIGGIFQLALVLHDNLIEEQTVEIFNNVCIPKVDATINLDKLSRDLSYHLDYFVTFSSIACGRGNMGQSPYGYGCSVMERICEARRREGLHGLAIQWGPIGDVGVIADIYNEGKLKSLGLIMQRSPSWIYALDKFLQCSYPVVASTIQKRKEISLKTIEDNTIKQLWSSMGIDPKRVANNLSLGEIGMESFVAVELQQRMERDYDINLSLDETKQITIGELKQFEKGNKESIKQYAVDVKIAKQNFGKIQFELTNEQVTNLNDIKSGKPIYVLPPLESNFDGLISLLSLTKLLPFPVYGLNWTYEIEKLKSINEIALHYSNLMKTLEPKGDYTLMTTSFGSVIGFRMAYKNESIKNLIVIESDFMREALNEDEDEDSHELFIKRIKFLKRYVPKLHHDRLVNEILKVKGDQQAKMNKLIEFLKKMCLPSRSKDLYLILNGILKKSKMIMEFKKIRLEKYKKISNNEINYKLAKRKLKKRIKCDLIIIRSDVDLEEKQFQEEEFYKNYGIDKQVSLRKFFA